MPIPKYLLPLVLFCLTLGPVADLYAADGLPAVVRDALQRAAIPPGAVGAYVQDVGAAQPMLLANARTPFNPASTMKLVTSDAALELLGPAYTWKTQAYVTGVQAAGVLQGDLLLRGGGDPKLVTENLWQFLRQIRATGIREIRGDLLLDRSLFEDVPFDAAQFDGDPAKPYNAAPDALLLNYKALQFRFMPGASRSVVNVTTDPPMADFPVVAPVLSNRPCGDWQEQLGASITPTGATFNGVYQAACGDRNWYIHPYLLTNTQYFSAVFRQLWTDVGGTFTGEVRNAPIPPEARLIAEWKSVALPEVIRDINKYSNNVMARQLLLTLAADVTKQPGNPQRGAQTVAAWLAGKGIDTSQLVIENGSGLSRVERITPDTMGRMLVDAFRSPTMPELMSSMPLVGLDGTMRRRLTDRSVSGRAHIKTGSLNEVRAIAGYVLAASGRRYAVVCIINHPNAVRGQAAHDALLQWVYENG